jgi:hypothetical protein
MIRRSSPSSTDHFPETTRGPRPILQGASAATVSVRNPDSVTGRRRSRVGRLVQAGENAGGFLQPEPTRKRAELPEIRRSESGVSKCSTSPTACSCPPRRLSFRHSLLLIRNFLVSAWLATPGALPKRLAALHEEVALLLLPKRRPRRYAREVKIKMSNYPRRPRPSAGIYPDGLKGFILATTKVSTSA